MKKSGHLAGLNAPQLEAVKLIDGPLLVLAGAGSGKTRVITHRVAHIIASGAAKPNNILAVTFTNKAAGEMKNRIVDLLGPIGRWVWISTFHSLCARVLRDHAEAIGFKRGFSIYDDSESKALIKRVYKDKGIPETQPAPGVARTRISRAKDRLITEDAFEKKAADFIEVNVAGIYKEYQRRLTASQAMDFDDLLVKTVRLFEKNPEILRLYQDKFRYILVDEYQDTNHAQYRLVSLLAKKNRNLCVVGDDDQSIYGWRGADINNILDFEDDYPDCRAIKLEQNYRSTQVILDAAGDVVSRVTGRKVKKLFTERTGGEKISVFLCGDDMDEAEAIAQTIEHQTTHDKSPSDFAILYRTNAQSRVLEDSLRYKGLPYTIVGGVRFYERAEVKDILAYLRLLINPDDDLAFLRIVNVPKRGIGKTGLGRIESYATERGLSLMTAIRLSLDETGIRGKAKRELENFISDMDELASRVDDLPPQDIAARLIQKIKYIEILEAEGTPEADVRADNVKELVAGIEEYAEREEEPTLAGFLEEVSLITDIDTWNDSEQSVTLMTLHSAKGLEFDSVFIAGMEEGLFPLQRGFDDSSDPDEERRLCYVGMTRAKSKLYLTLAGFRRRWGDFTGGPSTFLKDIPEDDLEVMRFNYWKDVAGEEKTDRAGGRRRKKTAQKEFEEFDYDDVFVHGAVVLHEKFGRGVIMGREGSGEDLIVNINFEQAGQKSIMVKYAALEVLGR
jgi:DNA helicase-2/ATP-dependent DNA helicase PcrA